ncbi:MAG: DNA primase [Desulfuromonadales bacterium]|nr:DNA primase [Desulfuromonadales bacterium]MDT8422505.1 DNA primase [Desulfuromonadales bacterium]
MSGRIAESKIQEIRERVDIVEVISSYLPLKRSGANHQGLCPFHGEKTPSFNVNSPRQIFHCFGCGVGGNVFTFLMRMEGLTFPEAIRRLGEQVGIEVEQEEATPAEIARRKEREQFDLVNEEACNFYQHLLLDAPEGEPARRYLKARGYDRAAAESYRLGYAPEQWEMLARHLATRKFDPRISRQLGLIRPGKEGRGDYDLFRGRLLFPILDVTGKVVAFGGRVLDDSLPKYINSPESPVYSKGRVLFGLFQAKEAMRRAGEVIIVEGYFDQLALNRSELGHALATCGTALTPDHARLLKRYTERVVLLFDQDKAGQQATFRAMDALFPGGLPVLVATLPDNADPDSFLQEQGADALRAQLAQAVPALDYFIATQLGACGDDVEAKARAVEAVIAKIKLLTSDVEQQLYLHQLADRSGLDERFLHSKLGRRSSATRSAAAPSRNVSPPLKAYPVVAPPRDATARAQEWLLCLLLTDVDMRRKLFAVGVENLFFMEPYRSLALVAAASADADNFDEQRLQDRLTPEQTELLSGILILEESVADCDRDALIADCRQAAEKYRLRQRLNDVKEQLKNLNTGDAERLMELQREQQEISRCLKNDKLKRQTEPFA